MTSRPRPHPSSTPPAAGSARAVVLIGFMASGKTSVGRALSHMLGWTFHDLDARVEAQEGRSIPQIFREAGEAHFRHAEREALSTLLKELSPSSPAVIALGGGAFAQSEIRRLLAQAGVPAVWLDAPHEELWQRCLGESVDCHLARNQNQFRQLYEERRKHYTEAALHIHTNGKDVAEIAEELIGRLGLNRHLKEK